MLNETVSYSDLRENLKACLDKVCNDSVPLLVKRRNGEDVVIVSRRDYESLDETAYLLSSPANKKRLLEGMHEEGTTYESLEALNDAIERQAESTE